MSLAAAALVALLLAPAPARAGLDRVVGDAVRANYEAIHTCYRRAVLARDRARGGTLFVRVTLGANDAVRVASTARDELGSAALASCVLGWVRGWTLRGAAAAGAGPGSEVVLPLTFQPVPDQIAVREEDAEEVPLPSPGKGRFRRLLTGKNSGARLAELEAIELDGELALGGSARALLLLEGKGTLVAGTPPRPRPVAAGMALFVPASAKATLRGKLRALCARLPKDPFAREGRAVVVASPGRVARRGAARATPVLDRKALRERPLYLGLLAAEAGARTPAHEHERAAELVFLRAGKVRITLSAGRVLEIGAGTALHLAPGARHELAVLERAQAVQIFVPGGPEDTASGESR